jgi:NAD(P)H-dependent flavin oxidoreductase YrpB (nitropropane dioxygenase family)
VSEFIFMLTHNDATVANARDVLAELAESRLRYVGFKDVGAPHATLRDLAADAHEAGMEVMLEIVATDPREELRSLEAAAEIGVDWVLGGTHPAEGVAFLAGTGIRYCPFPGTVEGHPSVLKGTHEEIAEHARRLAATDGVAGVDLLAYRHQTLDPLALTRSVVDAVDGPVIVAGSITTLEQISALDRAGAWGFTIGGAIFEGRLPGGPTVPGQVAAVLEAAGGTAEPV